MNLSPYLAQLSEWLGVIAVAMLAGISPRFTHKPIAFRYPRRELNVSAALFAASMAVAVIVYLIFPPEAAAKAPASRLIAGVLCLFLFFMALRVRGQPLRSAGWNPALIRPALILGLALAVLALFLRGVIFSMARRIGQSEGLALLVWLGICTAEESIFRGYLQTRLVALWGLWPGIAAGAALYLVWYLPLVLLAGLGLEAALIRLGLALLQGLVLGYTAQRSGHVLPGIVYRAVSEWAAAIIL